jgi:hypothetical protein
VDEMEARVIRKGVGEKCISISISAMMAFFMAVKVQKTDEGGGGWTV